MACNFVGGTPWQPTEDLHDGAGAEFAELRARPLLLGSDATKPPSDAETEDLESLADAYEGWLAAWPAAVGAWSSDPYIALASPAVLAERDRLFTHPAIDWGPAWPTCSPFTRSDAWLGAAISGDAAVTYSWRRGEAARCTDDATGRDLPTATACVGPLYAVAVLWQRNPGGDPPWLVVSETHRDPLHSDGPRRFDQALAAAHWDAVLTLHTAYAQRIASEESRSDYGACEIRATPARAGTAASSAPDQDHPLASLAPAAPSPPPQWTPDASGTRFWLGRPGDPGAVAIVILGGDRVPYDGEQVPAVDPAPGDVREHLEDVGGGFITHCRDLPNEERTCWARAGWLVRDEAQDAPWLGAPSVEELGSGWDYCRSVDGEDARVLARGLPASCGGAAGPACAAASGGHPRRMARSALSRPPILPPRARRRSAVLARLRCARRRHLAPDRAPERAPLVRTPRPRRRLPLRGGRRRTRPRLLRADCRRSCTHRREPRPAAGLSPARRFALRASLDR